jgi:hypothetical protein
MLRRVVLAILFWFVIGALATITISWSIAAWMPLRPTSTRWLTESRQYAFQEDLSIQVYRGTGWTRRAWRLLIPGMRTFSTFGRVVHRKPEIPPIEDAVSSPVTWPIWGRLESVRVAPRSIPLEGCEHATGWPFPALWYDFDASWKGFSPPIIEVRGGVQLNKPATGNTARVELVRAIPLRPVWAGFVLNTLLWGSGMYLLYMLTFRFRGFLRFRRNHCPRCNYDLSASPTTCPECGWNRDLRASSSMTPTP